MITALRTPAGDAWGALGLYREPGYAMFDHDDIAFLRSLAPCLAEGARRALLIGEASDPEGPASPGLVVLSDDWNVESATPGVERWLCELPDGDWDAGRLPAAVLAVAGRALRAAENPDSPGEVAVSRVPLAFGDVDRAPRCGARGRWLAARRGDRRARTRPASLR